MAARATPKTKASTAPSTAGKSSRIHAVVGSDECEVKRAALEMAESLMPAAAGDLARDIIDGCVDNSDQAATRVHATIDALLTLPFFGGEKLVWLKNANFLADSVVGRAAATTEALEKLVEVLQSGVPENVQFLLSAPEIDKRRTFYKTLGKIGAVTVFDKVDASQSGWEEAAAGVIEARARQLGLGFTADALELFVACTGGERRAVESELQKLDLYLGAERRRVSLDDVRTLTPISRVGAIFELGNALAKRDLNRCFVLIEQMLERGESPLGILIASIVPTVRNLLVARDLLDRHGLRPPQAPHFFASSLSRLPPEATEHLPRKKDGTVNAYALGIAAMQARNFDTADLKKLFEGCLRANVQLVSTQHDPGVVLAELVGSVRVD